MTPRRHFSTRHYSLIHIKGFTGLPPPHFHPSLTCAISEFVTDRAYLGSFKTASWASYEFGRIMGAFTATIERDVAGHHAGLLYLNA
ncbi:hypothetical protein TNCV_2583751 [Trichonephila clavipes]|nr:hypothetical protein TNCV_2583751 [Trichonephila clavipes]